MSYFEISNFDWELFEEKYNIPRTKMVEVTNIFRHICRLFVLETDVNLWNTKKNNLENVEINYYHITDKKYGRVQY